MRFYYSCTHRLIQCNNCIKERYGMMFKPRKYNFMRSEHHQFYWGMVCIEGSNECKLWIYPSIAHVMLSGWQTWHTDVTLYFIFNEKMQKQKQVLALIVQWCLTYHVTRQRNTYSHSLVIVLLLLLYWDFCLVCILNTMGLTVLSLSLILTFPPPPPSHSGYPCNAEMI